jgi:hypothetical protein
MGANSISFSLGGPKKRDSTAKTGFGIKPVSKAASVSAVFGADDSDHEEDERDTTDQAAKRQRLDSSGLAFYLHRRLNTCMELPNLTGWLVCPFVACGGFVSQPQRDQEC